MTEVIRYSLIGASDVKFGTDTFEVTLADGRVVVLEAINAGHIPGLTVNETVDATMADVSRARRGLAQLWDFDQDDATTTGLTWGYTSGMAGDGTGAIAKGTLTLTANSTNYVEFDPETGVVSTNTSAFSPTDKVPLRTLVTNTTAVTTNTDVRPIWRQNVALIHGQCFLSWITSASIKLLPLNGNRLLINGTTQTIPSAGVSLSSSGLTVSTTYYLYAYMNGSTMTLEAATTSHATSSTDGVEIKSGDATRTYLGAVETDSSGVFRDNIRQWFRTYRDNAMTGLQQWKKGADVVAAGTPAILSDGNYFAVTGTTTITALPLLQAGTVLILRFDGVLTITHNATSLILSGAADIITSAGFVMGFVSEGSGNYREIFRANGGVTPPVVAGSPSKNALYSDTVPKCLASVAANGTLSEGFNMTSTAKTGTGAYTATWDRDFANTTYKPILTSLDAANRIVTSVTRNVGTMTYIFLDTAGNPQDTAHTIVVFGTQ